MEGDVVVHISHSTINYKDGLVLSAKSAVPRKFPMIAGIDFAGVVESSSHPNFKSGDAVLLNGYGLSETHFGGYAEKARVKGDWLVKIPAGMSAHDVMAIGTAGYTAMLSVLALEKHGLKPSDGAAIVTGAAGGVGSVAITLLKKQDGMSSRQQAVLKKRITSKNLVPLKSSTVKNSPNPVVRSAKSAG